jgi:long-subunit acyl-CoA synthetase (AMP-forming)
MYFLVARKLMDFFYRYKSYYRKRGMGTPILDAIIFRKMRSLVGGRIRSKHCIHTSF